MEIPSVASFTRYFENIRGRTERVFDSVPAEHGDWRPASGAFSFCDLMRHLGATERWMFAENVAGRPSRYPGHGEQLARGYEASRTYLQRMHAESMQIIGGLADADLELPCTTPGGATMARWKWLRAMVEHEVHHRGQIYLMLRLLELSGPPLYGLTSEEVKERSLDLPGEG